MLRVTQEFYDQGGSEMPKIWLEIGNLHNRANLASLESSVKFLTARLSTVFIKITYIYALLTVGPRFFEKDKPKAKTKSRKREANSKNRSVSQD